MPHTTPLVKVANTRDLGGEVLLHGENYDEALAHAHQLASERKLTFLHAFDDDAIIAGQGTIGLELLDEPVAFDAVVVPVGGGGLLGGIAVALKEQRPDIRVIGVEPENCASMKAALAGSRPIEIAAQPTIADGLSVRRVSERTLEIACRYVDEIVTVSEDEIASAMLKLLEIEKTVAEGGGAAALAAVFFRKITGLEGKNAALIISGGNIDPNLLSKIIERGLAKDSRMVRIRALVRDRPGELARICRHVATTGANILDVVHNRAFASMEIGGVEIDLTLETRGLEHMEELFRTLQADGISVHTDHVTHKEQVT